MIPADVASRLQVSADAALRPVAPAQEIADKLSGLVAGQKVMAEIQAMLPNGTYRAMINQRNITLALPFAAKSGDSLELQVTESDGKLALAVVAAKEGEGQKAAATTTSTLSRTGQLISDLFSSPRQGKDGPVTLPLNNNQPISNAPPASAQDLLPLLKQAISQSGMFYEAHQAEWVEGRLTKAALLQEPQGKLSSPTAFSAALEELSASAQQKPQTSATTGATLPAARLATESNTAPQTTSASVDTSKASATQSPAQIISPPTQPVVQMQLDALATQNYSWQGQVWPGQEMRWEINEDDARRNEADETTATKWTTRLNLTLPNLGEISAQIRLQGNQIALALTSSNAETRTMMRTASVALRSQLDEAGLTLASMGIDAATESKDYGQAGQ